MNTDKKEAIVNKILQVLIEEKLTIAEAEEIVFDIRLQVNNMTMLPSVSLHPTKEAALNESQKRSMYINKVNLYEEDKIRFEHDSYIQDRYGMKQGEGKLVCAKCDGTHEAKGIAAIHGDKMLELIYMCKCGNIMVSRTYS